MSASPPAAAGGREAGGRELLAIERRPLVEVRELGAVARVVGRELLGPRAGLHAGREDHPRPVLVLHGLLGARGHQQADRLLLLLGEVGQQAGGAREDRDGLHCRRREAEVEHDRRDRHRDVHRERLAPRLGHARRASAGRAVRGARSPRGRRRARGSARRAGRAAGGPDGRTRAPCRPTRGSRAATSRAAASGVLARRHPRLRRLEHPRALLRRAEDDRAAAEDPRRDGALQRVRGRPRASSARRRWSASCRARRSPRAAGRGSSAAPRSARGRRAAGGSTR